MGLYSNDDIMTVFKNNNFNKENPVSITTLMQLPFLKEIVRNSVH